MYLVDGNNVMGQRVGWHRDKTGARERLVRELAELGRRDRVIITVVFDGRVPEGMSDGEDVDGVHVFFAHPGSDADERIIGLAPGLAARQRDEPFLAVTSDRELARRLHALGVETMRSGEFRRKFDKR